MKLCLSISLSKKTTSIGCGFLLHNNIGEVLDASCVWVEKNLNTLIRDSFDFFFLFSFASICNHVALVLTNVAKKKEEVIV